MFRVVHHGDEIFFVQAPGAIPFGLPREEQEYMPEDPFGEVVREFMDGIDFFKKRAKRILIPRKSKRQINLAERPSVEYFGFLMILTWLSGIDRFTRMYPIMCLMPLSIIDMTSPKYISLRTRALAFVVHSLMAYCYVPIMGYVLWGKFFKPSPLSFQIVAFLCTNWSALSASNVISKVLKFRYNTFILFNFLLLFYGSFYFIRYYK